MTDISQTDNRTNGRWTKTEHQKFMQGIQLFGKDWKKIEKLIGTRNGAQIRSHAQKFFIKVKKELEGEHSDLCEQTIDSASEHQNSQPSSECQTKSEYSYFLNKIVEKSSKNEESFDFWSNLIDHKPINYDQLTYAPKRKSSFVSVSSQQSQEQCLRPRKFVKCE